MSEPWKDDPVSAQDLSFGDVSLTYRCGVSLRRKLFEKVRRVGASNPWRSRATLVYKTSFAPTAWHPPTHICGREEPPPGSAPGIPGLQSQVPWTSLATGATLPFIPSKPSRASQPPSVCQQKVEPAGSWGFRLFSIAPAVVIWSLPFPEPVGRRLRLIRVVSCE